MSTMNCLVTGAYGYSGRYISQRLLAAGHRVRTLTNSVNRDNPFDGTVEAVPFNFDNPEEMVASMKGFDVLINTYWVRFNHRLFTHADAVENTVKLFDAAQAAGVKRVVHVSITNPSQESELEYFKGKAYLEDYLMSLKMSYAILRPTVLFGREDILINNIAWGIRTFPLFPIFGDGMYRLQPIYVDDLATLAVEQASHTENTVINAIGPETYTYCDLVECIASTLGLTCRRVNVNPGLAWMAGVIAGCAVGDVIVTREEIKGLMQGLLYVPDSPSGSTKLSDWLKENSDIGRTYSSELRRRRDRTKAYK